MTGLEEVEDLGRSRTEENWSIVTQLTVLQSWRNISWSISRSLVRCKYCIFAVARLLSDLHGTNKLLAQIIATRITGQNI